MSLEGQVVDLEMALKDANQEIDRLEREVDNLKDRVEVLSDSLEESREYALELIADLNDRLNDLERGDEL